MRSRQQASQCNVRAWLLPLVAVRPGQACPAAAGLAAAGGGQYGKRVVQTIKTFLATWRPAGGAIQGVIVREMTG
ncbi:MAG TPA: hypothetical protein VNK04_11840 [Gemmataceae bacterium]|nr:hypothetical protein [Gemmataceae bacterium]